MNQRFYQWLAQRRPTIKLAATYLAVIMVMSVAFSCILYFTSIHGFDKRPAGPEYHFIQQDSDREIDEWLGRRAADNSSELAVRLVILNAVTLLVGACLSYFLARKTLQPIERIMQEQERFIADASHELRTPLTSILLSNEVALRNKNLQMKDARRLIEQNVEDIKGLNALSDELLDVSIDTKLPHIERHDVGQVIASAVDKAAPIARARKSTIVANGEPLTISTDGSMLGKIILILLDNAIKYSPEKSTISVSYERQGKWAVIAVQDQGQGIAVTDIHHIFERFYRVDSSRSQTNGHGLGLSIAAQLAQKVNAELAVESTVGKGSTFTLRLPI